VRLLIENGADFNARARERDGETALCAASRSGSKGVVDLLLSYGADVNAVASSVGSALYLAVLRQISEKEYWDWLILQRSEIIESALIRRETELKIWTEITQQLIRAGADIYAREGFNQSVLDSAVKNRDTTLLDSFIRDGVRVAPSNHTIPT
jgi:ankyrin repeat protein